MSYAVDTPKGRLSKQQEIRAIAIMSAYRPDLDWVISKDKGAELDGMVVSKELLMTEACFEVKSRPFSLESLNRTFDNRWLISINKIEAGQQVGKIYRIPFYGILYLWKYDLLLYQMIWHPKRKGADWEADQTETQATVNGGTAHRINAYVDMKNAKLIRSTDVGLSVMKW